MRNQKSKLTGNSKVVREEKVQKIAQLKAIVKDILLLLDRLHKELPQSHLRAKGPGKIPRARLKHPSKKAPEVNKLEKDLKQIESKLNLMM